MADLIDVNDIRMWFDDRGDGDPVVLLHGGFTDIRDFTGNLDALATRFRLLLPERRGHGHTPDPPGPYTLDLLADDTIAFVEAVVGGPVRLAGYSAGAIVALRAASRRPDLVTRLVLISGCADADAMVVRPTADGEFPPFLIDAYGEVSPDGRDHFDTVVRKVVASLDDSEPIPTSDLAAITCPVLVLTADDDFVTLEHSVELYRAFPDAQLAVVPGTSHGLLHEKAELCVRLVTDFLADDPVPTMIPLRRGDGPGLPADRPDRQTVTGV